MFDLESSETPFLRSSPNVSKRWKFAKLLLLSLSLVTLVVFVRQIYVYKGPENSIVRLEERVTMGSSCKTILEESRAECLNGWYWISSGKNARQVYCDMEMGGRMVILERQRGMTVADFGKTFQEYAEGFGSEYNFIESLGFVNRFSQEHPTVELRVEMNFQGLTYIASYTNFAIGTQEESFQLTLGGFSSPSGLEDDFGKHDQRKLTTWDVDNDFEEGANCALIEDRAGFWYDACWHVLFTGEINNPPPFKGVHWYSLTGPYESVQWLRLSIRE